MSWSWSHTHEAYENARRNLENLPDCELHVIFAEWRAAQNKSGAVSDGNAFNSRKYNRALQYAKTLSEDVLVDFIWDRMAEKSTCDNGGVNAWCCPSGCHTVPFDLELPSAHFNRFSIAMDKGIVLACSQSGDVTDNVRASVELVNWEGIDDEDIRAELREYGAWASEELADEDDNRERILWIAACNIKDTWNERGVK